LHKKVGTLTEPHCLRFQAANLYGDA